jgi:hypothetical protein
MLEAQCAGFLPAQQLLGLQRLISSMDDLEEVKCSQMIANRE